MKLHTSTGRWAVVASVLILVGFAVPGCSGELDPTEPSEAYLLFRKALKKGQVDAMWNRCADSTKQYFEDRHQQLVEMDRKIEKYLPQTDHKLARKQTGTELLDEVENGRALFEKIVTPKKLEVTEAGRLGSLIEEIRLSKNKKKAEVATRGGRTYRMVKQDDGEWYVALADSVDALDASFGWLDRNDKALTKTVNELKQEEREKREEIIAELMDVDE